MYDQRPLKSKLTITADSDVIEKIKGLRRRTIAQYPSTLTVC